MNAGAPSTIVLVAPTARAPSYANHQSAADEGHLKDAVLDSLAGSTNVAQFISFSPSSEPELRFARVHDVERVPGAVEAAVETLLTRTVEHQVNVRSFLPEQPRSHEFIYGIATAAEAAAAVRRLASDGLYTIVNETVDIHDGGVSGVSFGGIVEFAPDDTPRAVEKPGTAGLPASVGFRVLGAVYGFKPELPKDPSIRVEFSMHPIRRGYRHAHTIVWEQEAYERIELSVTPTWPNQFSRFLGDKTFGLLIADAIGLRVPRTTVVSRRVAPFTFGRPTGTREFWIRTAPTDQVPGKFATHHGWLDPYELLKQEDPAGTAIASVLSQEGVAAQFSGVAAGEADGTLRIEGVPGYGEAFMLGAAGPRSVPDHVRTDVEVTYARAATALGAARFEWVHDGTETWIVQLHQGGLPGHGRVIYPGTPTRTHTFDVTRGLEALRALVQTVQGTGEGIVLVGEAGVTSHLGDVLRKAMIPSRIESARP